MRKNVAAAVVLLACCVQLTIAQEWTRFRGPNGTGESEAKGILATWTEADYNWKATLPGIGHSSPVLWGEKLFLLSADPNSATRYILCLGADDGKEIWRREFKSDAHHLHPRNSFASCSPAVDDERVYVAWSTPDKSTVKALTHDGEDAWEIQLDPFVGMHGFGGSPMVYKDLLVLNMMSLESPEQLPKAQDYKKVGDAYVIALDRKTGETRWKTPRDSDVAGYSVPCVFTNADGRDELVCCASGNDVFSLNPEDGKLNWSVDAFSMRAVSSPVIAGGLIFGSTGSGGGGNYVVAVTPGKQAAIKYEIKQQAPYVPTPVARGDLLFLWSDGGVASCIDAPSGDTVWQKRIGSNFSGSPVRVGDKIYCIDEQGVVHVIAAEKEFKLLGKNPLGEPSRATPSVARGQMFLRTESQLISIGGGKG